MKKILILIGFICTMAHGFAQSEKSSYKAVADNFWKNYNDDNVEAIFNMFDPAMQTALPLDKAKSFFSNLKSQAGRMNKSEFILYDRGTSAVYKAVFERAILALHLSVNNNNKIDGFLINAYADNTLPKMERNTTRLVLPFRDEWTVIWGGDTKEQNYHVETQAQKNAFDILITDANGRSYKTDGKTNDDYYAFGNRFLPPAPVK